MLIDYAPPPRPAIVQAFQQDQPPPLRIPQTDITVEVVAELPMRTKLADVTRLLGRQHMSRSIYRTYLPTILQLIMLVEPNPVKPIGRAWLSITALNVGYDSVTKEVIAEYCIDNCTVDRRTLTLNPKRKMISYRTPEDKFVARLNQKLDKLKKFADRPPSREQ